jgi:type I restriction enzyme S subunit
MSNIREIATFISDGDWIESNDQSNYGIRLVQTGNIGNGEYLDKPDKAKYISEETCSRLNCTDVYEGDILISRLPDPIGRSCIVPQDIGRAITAVDCTILRVNHNIYNPQFFVYYTQTDLYKSRLSHYLTGTTRKRISRKNLENIVVPQYPKKEQDIIVNKLDMITNLISLRKQQLKNFDMLVKSRFIEMFGDLINEPKYPGIKLGSLGVMITGGTPSRKHDEYYGGNIPFISTPCLGSNFISEKNVQNYLTEAGVKNSATHKIPPYSLMVGNRVGVGKSSINTCEMCTNQDILSFVDIDTSRFDLLFLKKVIDQYSPYFDEHKRGATIQGVPSKVIKDSMVPDVPLEIQKRYTALVKQSDKSKMAVQKSLDELETLKKSLMQTYFG